MQLISKYQSRVKTSQENGRYFGLLSNTRDILIYCEGSFSRNWQTVQLDWLTDCIIIFFFRSRVFHSLYDVAITGRKTFALRSRHLSSREWSLSCHTGYDMECPLKTNKGYWGPNLTRIPTRDTHHAVLGCYRVHGKLVWTRRTIHRLFQNQRILFLFSWNLTVISQWESSTRFWYQNKELLLKPTRVLPVRFRLSNSSGNFCEKNTNQKVSFI